MAQHTAQLLGIGQEDQDEIVNWRPDWFDPSTPQPFPNPAKSVVSAEVE